VLLFIASLSRVRVALGLSPSPGWGPSLWVRSPVRVARTAPCCWRQSDALHRQPRQMGGRRLEPVSGRRHPQIRPRPAFRSSSSSIRGVVVVGVVETVDNPIPPSSDPLFCPHWTCGEPVEKLRLLWTQHPSPTGQLSCPQVFPNCIPRIVPGSPQPHWQHPVSSFTRNGEMLIDVAELWTLLWRTRPKLGTTGLVLGTAGG
jgi:hypothetical protein